MKLGRKNHWILVFVLLIGLLTIGIFSHDILDRHARGEVINQAGVLMEAALAMRKYTISEIKPLLALQNKREFLPQSVPSYAATQNFQALREIHPQYQYKEATLNPTNPRDRAMDWEADVIQTFRNNSDMDHITFVRDTSSGKKLYYARPIRIKNQSCLTCHGMIEDAPKTMLDLYGNANGFGWKMNEVVGSQIVSVPLALPIERANGTFFILISIVSAVFFCIYLVLVFFDKFLFSERIMTSKSYLDPVKAKKDMAREKDLAQKQVVTGAKDIKRKKAEIKKNIIARAIEVAGKKEAPQKKLVVRARNSSSQKAENSKKVITRTLEGAKSKTLDQRKEATVKPGAKQSDNRVRGRGAYNEPAGVSAQLDLPDLEEKPKEQSISLRNMYQKREIDASLLEDFELDDAITELTPDLIMDIENK